MLLNDLELIAERGRWQARIVDNCKLCGGRGYTVSPNGSYDLSRDCSCVKRADRNVRLVDYGVPRKFLDDRWTLDLLSDKTYHKTLVDYVENFDDNFLNGRGLFLTGPHGRGKSTISCVIAKLIAMKVNQITRDKRFFNVAFLIYDDAVHMQLDKDPARQRVLNTMLYKSDLLIIDNVGNEMGKNDNRFSQRMLEIILRKRDNDCLPTIISSNYNADELATEYNDDVRDFILQNNDLIYVTGDNHRVNNGSVNDF